MLRIAEPIDRPFDWRTRFCSLLVSLLVHFGLAVILWCFVYANLQREPILLTASASSITENEIPLEFLRQEGANRAPPIERASTPAPVPVDLWVSRRIKSNVIADRIRRAVEPASVDFFGTRAMGTQFVYVLDISFSMDARDGARFDRACEELLRSVSQLRTGQSYYVILFCWKTEMMFDDSSVEYIQVAAGHEDRLRDWIDDVRLGAGTDPRRALSLARQLKPDAVFLLSDGHFNRPGTPYSKTGWIDEDGHRLQNLDVQQGIDRFFREIPIHTIALENPFTYKAMEQIANATQGVYRYIKTSNHEPIDNKRFLTALRHIDEKHRNDTQPDREYQTRLSYARELTADGELIYAEYILRPLRRAKRSKIVNPVLLDQLLSVLDSELGERRLEDYQPAPELSEILDRNP